MSFGVAVIVVLAVIAVIALCWLAICIWAAEKPVTVAPDYADMGVPAAQRRVQLAAPAAPPVGTWLCTIRSKVDGRWVRLGVREFVWPAWSGAEVESEIYRWIEENQPRGEYRVDVTRATQNAA